ncbi:Archaellum biogenesis protein FlaJ, TadC family [Halorientalis persicus]|jgi:archaellum biogenesis protein FlaJ (TadC family)|uniref:Archaellum biogenesis protein FlaJ, TadC family n=1 Tax=Halorientalis persicus TaxID=1367881 RepID=A0A1H8SUP1_9EURY|nr:type II secretion system F family protein [Halorientalis persicus]SEO81893.1 Archaellum biogenesis protein FlaJ, TadC family [Halorientalis persicus]
MATTDHETAANPATGTRSLSVLDRGLYALFSRHADRPRHERDRKRYRAANLPTGFDVYLARVYGASWVVLVALAVLTGTVTAALPATLIDGIVGFLGSGLPVVNRIGLPAIPRLYVALGAGLVTGLAGKRLTVWTGGLYLRWVASARRSSIERTLPGAVRYLRVLATGTSDQRTMLRTVADQDAYGETAVAFRTALNKAELTGSVDEGLEMVARDTPSTDLLAPFLLKFREHANQGGDALANYLQLEGRMLSNREARARERTSGFLELLSELFVVLLVLPALFVLILTVMSVLAPGLSEPVATPVGPVATRTILVYGSGAFVLAVGAGSALLVESLRPAEHSTGRYDLPENALSLLESVPTNPASAAVVTAPLACGIAVLLWTWSYRPLNAVLLGYVAFGLPVGIVAVRRARLDDAKDREIKDFVHAVSGHVSLGRPFPDAVERVAREVDLGALQDDVDDLAFTMNLTTGGDRNEDTTDVQAAALAQFVDQVGTPMAEQTMGLVTGALDAGSDSEDVFETLQTEIGRLYHARKQLRSSLLVYVAVGWTTALLVVAIMVAVNGYVLDGFTQLSSVAGSSAGLAISPDAVEPARDRWRFYVVTQATMLACGWFAGTASRGRYEALLHSAALVGVAYVVFTGAGMV